MSRVSYRKVKPEDLNKVYELESNSYPPDEAATYEKLKFRIENASFVFLIAELDGDIIGFVNGTCSKSETLTHNSMSSHEVDGSTLCIHSVVIQSQLRRRGLALQMLEHYNVFLKQNAPHISRICLICKTNMVSLYSKAGFQMIGPSDVVHGQDPWFEMYKMP
mmetsp:Transcript_29421/g.53992  ORF Transcript_29421/g.53992 Transcript_29421/m.53992 type:complete len:163 (+) Transcript_29421:88-576(+)